MTWTLSMPGVGGNLWFRAHGGICCASVVAIAACAAPVIAALGAAVCDLLGVGDSPLITPPSDDPRGRRTGALAVAPLPFPTSFASADEGAGRAGALAFCGVGGATFLGGCGL